jgi:transcriptional regulator with XRE-family HTH domain
MKTYGEMLRLLRRNSHKSLEDLASIAGCSISFVSQVERGVKNPPPDDVTEKWLCFLDATERLGELVMASRRSTKRLSVSTEGKDDRATNVLLSLARRYEADQLSEDEIEAIEKCLQKEEEE